MSNLAAQSDVDRVRDATELVTLIGEHLSLRLKGREHVGLCPFHDDHSPSLAVVTHKGGSGFYKCHSCGAAGDCFNFVMDYHKMGFGEALRYLADRARITLTPRAERRDTPAESTRADVRQANATAAEFFAATLRHPEAGEVGRSILTKRGISDEMVRAFQLGLAPPGFSGLLEALARRKLALDSFLAAGLIKVQKNGVGHFDTFRNRLVFPIADSLGQPIAFGARQIDPEDQPKYLNSPESALFHKSATLYGLHLAKRAIIDSKQAIVTEGYTDVIACHQAGVTNVVATLGTALTVEHARTLSRLCETVILLFDGDAAGMKAADRALEVFFAEPVDVKICVLSDEQDPDELLRSPGGRERLQSAVRMAREALVYKVDRFRAELRDVTSATARATRLERFIEELIALGFGRLQGTRRRLVTVQLSHLLDLPLAHVESAIEEARKRQERRPAAATAAHTAPLDVAEAPPEAGPVDSAEAPETLAPAQRRAERDLLSVLIFEPAVMMEMIEGDERVRRPVLEVLAPAAWVDPGLREVYALIHRLAVPAREISVEELLGHSDDAETRSLIGRLYEQGRRRCEGDSQRATAEFHAAAEAWAALARQRQYQRGLATAKRQPSSSGPILANIVDQRRRHGNNPLAMPRGIRS